MFYCLINKNCPDKTNYRGYLALWTGLVIYFFSIIIILLSEMSLNSMIWNICMLISILNLNSVFNQSRTVLKT